MKTINYLFIILLFPLSLLAQSPGQFNFQAVVRDGSNALLVSQAVGIRITILQNSATGTSVYSETHSPTTNTNGLITLDVGTGSNTSGNFNTIDWANGPYFLRTETDPLGGTSYTLSATTQLMSVPYALHANTADSLSANFSLNENDPLFVSSVASSISTADTTNWNNKLTSEVDGSITNEIQALSLSNDTLYLSNGGNTFLGDLGDSSKWIRNDTNIYTLNTGNVGIGTATPNIGLTILKDQMSIGANAFNQASSGRFTFEENFSSNLFCGFSFQHNGAANTLTLASGCSPLDTIATFPRTGAVTFGRNITIDGNLNVTGSISKASGTFKIDHPLEPENKYLIHSFVESPDMLNVYSGNIITDINGFATVKLPSYFEKANKDFRYQLTVIGSFAQAIINKKVQDNQFIIQTSEPNIEVSWQVTGVRNDKYSNENRIIPELEKEFEGYYIHPELYNQNKSRSIYKKILLEENKDSNAADQ